MAATSSRVVLRSAESSHVSSASRISPASANRSSGSRVSARFTMATSPSGTSGECSASDGIGPTASVWSVTMSFTRGKRCRAASISHKQTPADQMSARRSTSPPTACSGEMYPNLPLITPLSVFARRVAAFAIPKSSKRTLPSQDSRMFAGLTSRCTMPSGEPS